MPFFVDKEQHHPPPLLRPRRPVPLCYFFSGVYSRRLSPAVAAKRLIPAHLLVPGGRSVGAATLNIDPACRG